MQQQTFGAHRIQGNIHCYRRNLRRWYCTSPCRFSGYFQRYLCRNTTFEDTELERWCAEGIKLEGTSADKHAIVGEEWCDVCGCWNNVLCPVQHRCRQCHTCFCSDEHWPLRLRSSSRRHHHFPRNQQSDHPHDRHGCSLLQWHHTRPVERRPTEENRIGSMKK